MRCPSSLPPPPDPLFIVSRLQRGGIYEIRDRLKFNNVENFKILKLSTRNVEKLFVKLFNHVEDILQYNSVPNHSFYNTTSPTITLYSWIISDHEKQAGAYTHA